MWEEEAFLAEDDRGGGAQRYYRFGSFCRRHRLNESQFYWWQRKLKQVDRNGHCAGKESTGERRTLPGQRLKPGATDPASELVLGTDVGLRIRKGVDEETLRAVLAAVRAIEMLSFPAASKVYLCTVPCDMRRLVRLVVHDGGIHHPGVIRSRTSAGVLQPAGVIE